GHEPGEEGAAAPRQGKEGSQAGQGESDPGGEEQAADALDRLRGSAQRRCRPLGGAALRGSFLARRAAPLWRTAPSLWRGGTAVLRQRLSRHQGHPFSRRNEGRDLGLSPSTIRDSPTGLSSNPERGSVG